LLKHIRNRQTGVGDELVAFTPKGGCLLKHLWLLGSDFPKAH